MDIASYLIGSKLGGGGGGGGGGASVESKDVDFIDYDGTIVYSYSKADFLALSAMPDNPSHDGLTAQGWNWTLADAQSYVTNNGKLIIGQIYKTASGKTEIDIVLPDGRLSPYLAFMVDGSAVVEWGDGSANTTVTNANKAVVNYTQHTFPSGGAYTIKISGSIGFYGGANRCKILSSAATSTVYNLDYVYENSVKAVRLSEYVYTSPLQNYCLAYCRGLETITIPNHVTTIDRSCFVQTSNLKAVVFPASWTSAAGTQIFAYSAVEKLSFAKTNYSNSQFLYNSTSIKRLTLPFGSYNAVESSVAYGCHGLKEAIIPEGITTIGSNAFTECYSLGSVTIPASVTSIAGNVFQNCYGMGSITFKGSTPPTVTNSSAFLNVPTDCVIRVPQGSKATYTSATNYPSSATYTYVEY